MRFALLFALSLLTLSVHAQSFTREEIHRAVRQAGGAEQFLALMAEDGTKASGRMLDGQTQLLSVQSFGRTIVFYNRQTSWSESDYADVELLRRTIAQRNAPAVCTAPTASILIQEYGVQYKYMIYATNRKYLFEYSFDRRTCNPNFVW